MQKIILALFISLFLINPVFSEVKKPLATAEGWNGIVNVYDDKVEIIRKEKLILLFANFTIGDKEIPIKQISGIQFKKAGSIVGGFIRFSIPGSGGVVNVNADENSVVFTQRQQSGFVQVKQVLEELINKTNSNNSSF